MRLARKGGGTEATVATDPKGSHVIGQMNGVDIIAGTWSEGSCYYRRGSVKIPRKAGRLPSLDEAIQLFGDRDRVNGARNHRFKSSTLLRDLGDGFGVWRGVFGGRNTVFVTDGFVTCNLPRNLRLDAVTIPQIRSLLSPKIVHNHEDDEGRMVVADGIRGHYVTDGTVTVSVPRGQDPLMVTARKARALLTEAYSSRTDEVEE